MGSEEERRTRWVCFYFYDTFISHSSCIPLFIASAVEETERFLTCSLCSEHMGKPIACRHLRTLKRTPQISTVNPILQRLKSKAESPIRVHPTPSKKTEHSDIPQPSEEIFDSEISTENVTSEMLEKNMPKLNRMK